MNVSDGLGFASALARRTAQMHLRAGMLEGVGREDADEAAHGAATVERTLRTAQYIHALHIHETEIVGRTVGEGHVVYVKTNGRRTDARTHTANVGRRRDARTIGRQKDVGHSDGEALDVGGTECLQILLTEERGRQRLPFEKSGLLRRCHNDGLFNVIDARSVNNAGSQCSGQSRQREK